MERKRKESFNKTAFFEEQLDLYSMPLIKNRKLPGLFVHFLTFAFAYLLLIRL